MNGYYSVFDPDGKKIADCGIERDAVNLMHTRNKYWDGHYFTFNPLPGEIIDVVSNNRLPSDGRWRKVDYVEVNGQRLDVQQQLPQSEQEPFIPDFHD